MFHASKSHNIVPLRCIIALLYHCILYLRPSKMHLFSSFLKYTAPVAIWFITNVFSTYYSKKLLVLHNEENNGDVDVFETRGDIWYSMLHLALWLTFTQLLVSGTIGALIVRIPCTNKTADEEALLDKKEASQPSSLLTFLFEAREKKHPTYNKILLTAACNALGSLCVNIAYIHGSVSLVQIIKTLEPVTTYVLSVGLLNSMRHCHDSCRGGLHLLERFLIQSHFCSCRPCI